jgi:DNA-directed RNA polymerase specialized sigma24 family protein
MLAQATLNGDTKGQAALGSLCGRYRPAVLRFVQRRGLSPEDAEDVTQDFFQNLLSSRLWTHAERSRGKFRNFLCGAVVHRLNTRLRENMADKRGGGQQMHSLDVLRENGGPHEPSLPEEVSDIFDVVWAKELLLNAVKHAELIYAAEGKASKFSELRRFLPGAGAPPPQAEAAARLGISESQLRVELSRLRTRIREALRNEIARTVSVPHEVDEEMTHLFSVLNNSSGNY